MWAFYCLYLANYTSKFDCDERHSLYNDTEDSLCKMTRVYQLWKEAFFVTDEVQVWRLLLWYLFDTDSWRRYIYELSFDQIIYHTESVIVRGHSNTRSLKIN